MKKFKLNDRRKLEEEYENHGNWFYYEKDIKRLIKIIKSKLKYLKTEERFWLAKEIDKLTGWEDKR